MITAEEASKSFGTTIYEVNQMLKMYRDENKKTENTQTSLAERIESTKSEIEQLKAEYASSFDSARSSLDGMSDLFTALNKKIEKTNISDPFKEAYEKSFSSAQSSINGQIKLFGNLEKIQIQAIDVLDEFAKAQQEIYEKNYQAAFDSIGKQIDLFGQYDKEVGYSVDGIINNLKHQAQYLYDYNSNLQKVMSKGISDELVEQLSDGTEKSAMVLAQLANASDEEIESINKSFGDVKTGKTSFSLIVSDMQTKFGDSMTTVEKSAKTASEEVDYSAQSMINSMQKHINYLDTYNVNLKTAMERGIDEGIVMQFSDGSQESARILASLITSTDEDIAEINANFAKVNEGKVKFATAVAQMETDYNKAMGNIKSLSKTTVDEVDYSINAIIQKQNDSLIEIEKYTDNLKKVMEKGIDEGFVQQYADGSEDSKKLMKSLAGATDEEIQEINKNFRKVKEGKDAFGTIMQELNKDFAVQAESLGNTLETLLTKNLNLNATAKYIGENITEGLKQGIDGTIWKVSASVEDLGNAITKTIKKNQEIQSPSKVMKGIGQYITEGLAIGIEDKENLVANAMRNVNKRITGRVNVGSNGSGAVYGGGYAIGGNGSIVFNAPMYLDGRILTASTSVLQYRRNQSRARAVGVKI